MRWLLLIASLSSTRIPSARAQNADSADVFRQARQAEGGYESSIRRYAPFMLSRTAGRACDEMVGRYCVYYDNGDEVPPPEPREIDHARDSAIEALQRALALQASRADVAFPLVRFLVQDGRAIDAVEVARRFAQAATNPADAHMLLGYSLNAARETGEAALELETWLRLLPPEDSERVSRLDWLLAPDARSRYRRMGAPARQAYEQRVWRFADALYLTAGNETWTDHLARYALAAMLSRRRGSAAVESWGQDLDQLTVRFGPPFRTTMSRSAGSLGTTFNYSEHWDPSLRTYVPPDIDSALTMRARVDTVWPLDPITTRSGHAPAPIRIMRVLEHQAAVFRGSAASLMVVGTATLDSLARGLHPRAAVYLLDSALRIVGGGPVQARVLGDSVVVTGEVQLPEGARFYSAEIYDPDSHFAARARYLVEPRASSGLRLSSLLLARPFDPGAVPGDRASSLLIPLSRPVLEAGSSLGLYAELTAPGTTRHPIQIGLENIRLDRPSGLAKAIGWIGRKLGLADEQVRGKLGWTVDADPNRQNAVAITLDLGKAEPGRYLLRMTARDAATGVNASVQREIVIIGHRATN